MRMMARNSVSENLQQKIDASVKKIATEAYDVALAHIRCAPRPAARPARPPGDSLSAGPCCAPAAQGCAPLALPSLDSPPARRC